MMDEEMRFQAIMAAVRDPSSDYYKNIARHCNDAVAKSRLAKTSARYVTIPFAMSDADEAALETQFSVSLRVKGGPVRARLTPRVAGLLTLLDSAMMEYAGSGGRTMLLIDGDLASLAAVGMERKIVERTSAHSRLMVGYFHEDELLRSMKLAESVKLSSAARILASELIMGSGAHYSQKLRFEGPKVDGVVVNHFRTPVGLNQLARFTHARGGVLYGAFPFQTSMLTQTSGRLDCFPGHFYVDEGTDTITLVPESDACMSISHPYRALMEIMQTNSFIEDGIEYLCEKYASVRGVMYYTLSRVGMKYDVPETLRSYLFDSSLVGVTEISYPKVKLSAEGVPVGYERGTVRILTSRLEKVLARAATYKDELVTPMVVYTMLMNYNNTALNSLDTAVCAERMDEVDQNEAALAIALHVNWTRSAARGALKVLLNAVSLKFGVKNLAMYKFAGLALTAWWTRPSVLGESSESLPSAKIVDWCGSDFTVVMNEVDPWVTMVSVTGQKNAVSGTRFSYFPGCVERVGVKKRKAVDAVGPVVSTGRGFLSVKSPSQTVLAVEVCTTAVAERPNRVLPSVKEELLRKLAKDQGATCDTPAEREFTVADGGVGAEVPMVVVPVVDPVAAIRGDLNDIVGGLPDRDMATTGFRLAEVDDSRCTNGNVQINDSKRAVAKGKWIRRPKVDAGVEGKRVSTQASLIAATYKRNVGIPNGRGIVDLDTLPVQTVQRVINTCFKDNWQDIVAKHMNTGMWVPNEEDLHEFVAGVDAKKVDSMQKEFFLEDEITLDRWLLMAKGKIKSNPEAGSEAKVNHSQTIMYLQSMCTNAMYSSMTKRAKLCIDECLIDSVKLNPQWSPEESEEWYNTREFDRSSRANVYNYSVDTSACDRSQELVGLCCELEFYRRIGLDEHTLAVWRQTHGKKKAMSMGLGFVVSMVLGGVSGLFKTLLRNGVITLCSLVVSADLRREDIVSLRIKGDDVDLEVARPVKVETAVVNMAMIFNFTSKFNTARARYFCKNFMIKIMGRWVEVADPWARMQSLCTPIWVDGSDVSLEEKWISLCADLRHYENGLVVDAAAEASQIQHGFKVTPYGMAQALAAIKMDKNRYFSFFFPPEYVE